MLLEEYPFIFKVWTAIREVEVHLGERFWFSIYYTKTPVLLCNPGIGGIHFRLYLTMWGVMLYWEQRQQFSMENFMSLVELLSAGLPLGNFSTDFEVDGKISSMTV